MARPKKNPETEPAKKAKSKKWKSGWFITGFGQVNEGDELTPEAKKAWEAINGSPDIANYVE